MLLSLACHLFLQLQGLQSRLLGLLVLNISFRQQSGGLCHVFLPFNSGIDFAGELLLSLQLPKFGFVSIIIKVDLGVVAEDLEAVALLGFENVPP